VVVGSGSVVVGGAVVGGGSVVVVGGPRRGPGPDDGPDCAPSCGGEVTGTVAIGAAAGAGAAVVAVVVVVDSATAVVDGGRICCTSTGAATGAAAVVGVLSRFAGTPRGCSAPASNATATKPATNARHTSDIVVVTTCARPTRRRPDDAGEASGSTVAPHSGHRAYAPLIGDPHVPQYCATARASCTVERLTGPLLRGTGMGHSSCLVRLPTSDR
jgi:hypothetical protein